METIALRLYGKNDIRLERFQLPAIKETEILADIQSNSICMSSYKAAIQGADHKRVPNNVGQHPVIVGHELCGNILEVGTGVESHIRPGSKYSIQPALNIPGRELEAPGYSFPYIGGHATKIIIPEEALTAGCLLPYEGEGYFKASLSEPVSCIVGAFNTSYHYTQGDYSHINGIKEGGSCAILAGAGPMGLGAIDFALHGPRQPRLLVVTDIDADRLGRAQSLYSEEDAALLGIHLKYVNTADHPSPEYMVGLTDGKGFDDVFVFAPVSAIVEQGSKILGFNGCLNFFAGPSNHDFEATINFYDVHYSGHHVVGSSGGNTEDMKSALQIMAAGKLNPAVMITHVGGIDAAADTILRLPDIPGGKKLIYTQKSLPLTALEDFEKLGTSDSLFAELGRITNAHNGLWSVEAEDYLLGNAPSVEL